jgi:hypothetical protein
MASATTASPIVRLQQPGTDLCTGLPVSCDAVCGGKTIADVNRALHSLNTRN